MRKEKGLCVKCGKCEPVENKSMCETCAEKHRNYIRESRKMCREIGICPVCQKNKLFGDEKTCPECLAKKMEFPSVKNPAPYKRKRSLYKWRKEQGLCTRCGKPNNNKTTVKCKTCLEKERLRGIEYRQKKTGVYIPRSERRHYGLCYFCGNEIDGYRNVCEKCADNVTKNFHHEIKAKSEV